MHDFLVHIEGLPFSTFVRESESLWAFPAFLFVHTLGMSIVAGSAMIMDFALLGLWPKVPVRPLEGFYPCLWLGFSLNLFTGVGMFMKDASTYSTNAAFLVKLLFVFAGISVQAMMRTRVFRDPRLDNGPVPGSARILASASLLCWFAAIVSGRLIAYVG